MMTRLSLLAVLVLGIFAGGASDTYGTSYSAGDMYSDRVLAQERPRYERRMSELLSVGLWGFMTGPEKQAVAGVRIDMPLRGQTPLDARAALSGGRPTVVLPALSLKFVEDLSVAYAWRYVNGYSLEPVSEYVAMLKYRRPEEFPGGRVPDPRAALGVPRRIVEEDARVDDVSLRFRNTAWAFILAHELGHLRFRHPGNLGVSPEVSRRNEAEADAFAVDLLSRSDTIPLGMILWFEATAGYFPNRADFESEAAYRAWTERSATHPVNPERLQRLAVLLNRTAGASLNRDYSEAVPVIAARLVQIGDILAEPDMQQLIAHCARHGRTEDLQRLHDRPCDERLR